MFHKRGWLISRSLVFFFFFFSVFFFFFFFFWGGGGGKRRRKGMITTFGIDPFRGGHLNAGIATFIITYICILI